MNATEPLEPRPWTARHWWTMVVLVLLAHFAIVCIFGAKQGPPARPPGRVPALKIASLNDQSIALNDPTLFALPHARDFASANWPLPATNQPPSFNWHEAPGWLWLSGDFSTKTFVQFMATNHSVDWSLNFKPEPEFNQPVPPEIPALPDHSTLHLRGELARRTLLNSRRLPEWPAAGIIAPSKVQVVVDTAGRVLSAALLPPDYGLELAARDAPADQYALECARASRFSPNQQLIVGQMIFKWHAVPVPPGPSATNNTPSPP